MTRFLALILSLATALTGNVAAAQETPDRVLSSLYRMHADGRPIVESASARSRFFAAAVAKKIAAFLDEEGAFDADPFYNGQDVQDGGVSVLKFGAPKMAGDKASVMVTFKNFTPQQLEYELINEKGVWRIVDIVYTAPKARFSDVLK